MSSGRYQFAPARRNVSWTPETHEAVSVWVDQVWARSEDKARRRVWKIVLLDIERERISERFRMVLSGVDRLAAARWQELRDGATPMSPEAIQAAAEREKQVHATDLQTALELFPSAEGEPHRGRPEPQVPLPLPPQERDDRPDEPMKPRVNSNRARHLELHGSRDERDLAADLAEARRRIRLLEVGLRALDAWTFDAQAREAKWKTEEEVRDILLPKFEEADLPVAQLVRMAILRAFGLMPSPQADTDEPAPDTDQSAIARAEMLARVATELLATVETISQSRSAVLTPEEEERLEAVVLRARATLGG